MRRRECMPQRSACSECGPACMPGRTPTVETPRTPARSQGFEVHDYLLPLLIIQVEIEGSDDGLRLDPVAHDGLHEGQSRAVVQQAVARPHAPQRRGAYLRPRRLPAVLDYPVARPHVVQQEVAERLDDLVAERCGDAERPAVDDRAGRGCHHLRDVADAATEGHTGHVVEEGLAGVDVRLENTLDVRVLRRGRGRTLELCVGRGVLVCVYVDVIGL